MHRRDGGDCCRVIVWIICHTKWLFLNVIGLIWGRRDRGCKITSPFRQKASLQAQEDSGQLDRVSQRAS